MRGREIFGCAIAFSVLIGIARAGTVTPTGGGSDEFGAGIPTGNSPDGSGNFYTLVVCYVDANGFLASQQVKVPITAAPKNPTPAQAAKASADKAAAIVKAINDAMIPGVTASVNAATMKGQYPTGNKVYDPKLMRNVPELKEFDQTLWTVNGTRESCWDGFGNQDSFVSNMMKKSYTNPTAKLGSGVYKKGLDPTKEAGNGKRSHKPPSPGGSMLDSLGLDTGTGAGTGSANATDQQGSDSVVGFGFIDYSSATPVNYLVSMNPTIGMNDAAVLGQLAADFTSEFSGYGYTASYDSSSDTLSIDQELSDDDTLWDVNTDPGLDLSTTLISVPEPMSLALFGLAGAMLRRRR